jgi:translocation and assembly module TamB
MTVSQTTLSGDLALGDAGAQGDIALSGGGVSGTLKLAPGTRRPMGRASIWC